MAPLSPSHRPGCARLGIARLKAFRLNVYEATWITRVNGLPVGGSAGTGFIIEGAAVEHVLNEQPDTARFVTRGFAVQPGQTMSVYSGELTLDHALFAGRILASTTRYDGKKENVLEDIQCIDPTWLMGRRKVLASYVSQSATAIVLDLIARFCRNVSTRNVVAGLPSIDAITFTNEGLPQCLTAVCERIGGSWYVDYSGDLHVFLSETEKAYDITDSTPRTSRNHALTEDLSQVVTRMIGRGGGVGASIDHAANSVELLIDEGDEPQSWYSPSGGTVEVNTQVINYSGVRGLGATGALVGTGNAPSAAPTPTPAAGSTHTIGATYLYATTFVTATGETLVGPTKAITIQSFSPVAPPAPSARSRGASAYPPGMISPGANQFRFYVQIQYRGGAWGPTSPQSTLYSWDGNDWEVFVGSRSYYTHSDGSSAFYYPSLEPGGPAAPTQSVAVFRIDN